MLARSLKFSLIFSISHFYVTYPYWRRVKNQFSTWFSALHKILPYKYYSRYLENKISILNIVQGVLKTSTITWQVAFPTKSKPTFLSNLFLKSSPFPKYRVLKLNLKFTVSPIPHKQQRISNWNFIHRYIPK